MRNTGSVGQDCVLTKKRKNWKLPLNWIKWTFIRYSLRKYKSGITTKVIVTVQSGLSVTIFTPIHCIRNLSGKLIKRWTSCFVMKFAVWYAQETWFGYRTISWCCYPPCCARSIRIWASVISTIYLSLPTNFSVYCRKGLKYWKVYWELILLLSTRTIICGILSVPWNVCCILSSNWMKYNLEIVWRE